MYDPIVTFVYLFTIIGIATLGVESGINSEVQRDFGTAASSVGYHVRSRLI
jgi:hypothetical protein